MNDDPTPPSPWTRPPAPPPPPPGGPLRQALRDHEMLVSVGLGLLAGGGAMLLIGALLVILS